MRGGRERRRRFIAQYQAAQSNGWKIGAASLPEFDFTFAAANPRSPPTIAAAMTLAEMRQALWCIRLRNWRPFLAFTASRIWRRVGEGEHISKSGSARTLAVWRAACVVCGDTFEVTILPRVASVENSRALTTTTCPLHRLSKAEAGKLRSSRQRETTAGQEEFFMAIGDPLESRTSPRPRHDKAQTEERIEKAKAVAPQYRTELLIP
jgi:hypothetical protein